MKQNLITDVIQGMLPYLNNAQTERLQEVLQYTLFDYEVTKIKKDEELSEQNLVESFLSAKRIEGCSEKTLKYYNATIQSMLDGMENLFCMYHMMKMMECGNFYVEKHMKQTKQS